MKAGWRSSTLGEVCRIVNGGTPKTGVAEYWNGPHQWITPAEMGKRNSPYITGTERAITDSGLKNCSASLLPPQSVILSSRAPIGHLVINEVAMATNQGCKGLLPFEVMDSKYLYYYLHANVQLLNDLGTGATFKELSSGKLKEVVIPFPSVDEQQRIVAILDEAFAEIAAAKTNAEKNLQNARALFESYLNKVFTEQGEGWVQRKLGDKDLLEMIDGDRSSNYPKSTDFLDVGPCLFLNTKNVREDGFDFVSTLFISAEKDAQLRKGKLSRDDVVMTTRGTIGNIGLYSEVVPFKHVRINSGMLVFRPNTEQILPSYLFEIFRSGIMRNQIRKYTTGAAQPQLPIKTLVNFSVPVPEKLERQAEMVRVIHDLEPETKRLESIYQQKLAALDELKQSLLHQAFSGQL